MSEESRITKIRKREISMAAKDVFLRKGFKNTTMEDVISEVGMSKGGVYYYYKSTLDILIDLCFIGQEVRKEISFEYKETHEQLSKEDILVELTILKMFGKSDYLNLYAMLLEVSSYDDEVKAQCEKMEKEQMKDFVSLAKENDMKKLIPLINEEFFMLMKSMYIARLYFDLEELYMEKSDLFRDIIRSYIRKHKEGSSE